MKHPNAIILLRKEIERLQGDNAKLQAMEPEVVSELAFISNTIENNQLRIEEMQGACMVLIKTPSKQ